METVKVELTQLELALAVAALEYVVKHDMVLPFYQAYVTGHEEQRVAVPDLKATNKATLEKLKAAQLQFRPFPNDPAWKR